jgi:hypothetical protein
VTAFRFPSAAALCLSVSSAAAAPSWQEQVLPIFREHCNGCHNPDKLKADLDLTSYAATMKGGSSGECVKPGNPDASLLFRVTAHLEEPEMPPKKPKLPDPALAILRDWIAGGAIESPGGSAAKSRDAALAASPLPASATPDGPAPLPENLPAAPDPAVLARPAPILALAASPRAPVLATAQSGGIAVHRTDERRLAGFLPFPDGQANVVRFSRDGSLVMAAGGRAAHSAHITIFDIRNGQKVADMATASSDAILAADLSPDRSLVATGGPDKIVRIHAIADGKEIRAIRKHTDWVTAVAFSPDGTKLATADRNGGLHLWDPATGTILFTLAEHQARITSLAWRADSVVLASAGDDGKLILWDTAEGWAAKSQTPSDPVKDGPGKRTVLLKSPGILSVDFAPDGRIVTTGRDRALRVFSSSGQLLSAQKDLAHLPTAAVFLPHANGVASADFKGSLLFWSWNEKQRKLSPEPNP